MFRRILIANRGEIALRIARACRGMNVQTVIVFSEADRGAPWLDAADEALCIGPGRAAQSDVNRVVCEPCMAVLPGDLAGQHGADRPVGVGDRKLDSNRPARLECGGG